MSVNSTSKSLSIRIYAFCHLRSPENGMRESLSSRPTRASALVPTTNHISPVGMVIENPQKNHPLRHLPSGRIYCIMER